METGPPREEEKSMEWKGGDSGTHVIHIPAVDDPEDHVLGEKEASNPSRTSSSTMDSYVVDPTRDRGEEEVEQIPGSEGSKEGNSLSHAEGEVQNPALSTSEHGTDEEAAQASAAADTWSAVDPEDEGSRFHWGYESSHEEDEIKEPGRTGMPESCLDAECVPPIVAVEPTTKQEESYASSPGWPHPDNDDDGDEYQKSKSLRRRRPYSSSKGTGDGVNSWNSAGHMPTAPDWPADFQSQNDPSKDRRSSTDWTHNPSNEVFRRGSGLQHVEPINSESELHSHFEGSECSTSGNYFGKEKVPNVREREEPVLEEGSSEVLEGSSGRNERLMSSSGGATGEEKENERESAAQMPLTPAGLLLRAVAFQVNLIVSVIAGGIWLLSFSLSVLFHPLSTSKAVKDKLASVVVGTVDRGLSVISSTREGASQLGPGMGSLSRKTCRGCFAAICIIFVMMFLLVIVMFMDLIILNRIVDKPVVMRQTLEFDYTHPKLYAVFPLIHPKEIERLKNLPPAKALKYRVIPPKHRFRITAVFTLPESEYNMNLGVFQVTTEVLSARDEVLMRSSKPCRLRFSSLPVRILKTLVYAVPISLGLKSETQKVEVRLLEAEEKITPTASVKISVESRGSYSGGAGAPDVYEAAVLLESTLPWWQAIVAKWKWTLFVWNGLCLFLFELSVVLCCCRNVLLPDFGTFGGAGNEVVKGNVRDDWAARDQSNSRRVIKRVDNFEDS